MGSSLRSKYYPTMEREFISTTSLKYCRSYFWLQTQYKLIIRWGLSRRTMPLPLSNSCLCPFSLLKYFFNVPESIFVSIHLNLLSIIALWKWYCLLLLIIYYKIYKDNLKCQPFLTLPIFLISNWEITENVSKVTLPRETNNIPNNFHFLSVSR